MNNPMRRPVVATVESGRPHHHKGDPASPGEPSTLPPVVIEAIQTLTSAADQLHKTVRTHQSVMLRGIRHKVLRPDPMTAASPMFPITVGPSALVGWSLVNTDAANPITVGFIDGQDPAASPMAVVTIPAGTSSHVNGGAGGGIAAINRISVVVLAGTGAVRGSVYTENS